MVWSKRFLGLFMLCLMAGQAAYAQSPEETVRWIYQSMAQPGSGQMRGLGYLSSPEQRAHFFSRRFVQFLAANDSHGARQTVHGGGKIGGRTAIDAEPGAGLSGGVLESRQSGLLDRVVHLDILRPCAHMAAQGQKTRMLARTIVVNLTGRDPGPDQTVARRNVGGLLWAAAKRILVQIELRQP